MLKDRRWMIDWTMSSEIRPRRLICLTGFMGSGKSTTAGLLVARPAGLAARRPRQAHHRIHRAFRSPKLFSRSGRAGVPPHRARATANAWSANRLESPKSRASFRSAAARFPQPQNLTLLRENGAALVWLHCPIEELLLRCATVTDRPLFRDESSFRRLYQERLPGL